MQVGHNSVELAMEWLIAHPEDPAAAAGAAGAAPAASAEGDEAQLAQALAASLNSGEPSKDTAVSSWPVTPFSALFIQSATFYDHCLMQLLCRGSDNCGADRMPPNSASGLSNQKKDHGWLRLLAMRQDGRDIFA